MFGDDEEEFYFQPLTFSVPIQENIPKATQYLEQLLSSTQENSDKQIKC
jgi:hypothetical protein